MKIYLILFIAFLISLAQLSAQNIDFVKENFPQDKGEMKEALKEIKLGDQQFIYGISGFQKAIKHYLKAYAFNQNNAMLNYKIGRTYILHTNDKRAMDYLLSAFRLNPRVNKDIHFYLGQAYHYNLQLEKAIEEFGNYQDTYTDEVSNNRRAKVNRKIKECKNGIELMANPVRVFIDNLGANVNTSSQEYAPVITADESMMIITSKRPGTTGGKMDENFNVFMEDIYVTKHRNGEWTKLENLGKPVNTTSHDASVGLSPDGQRMIIYYGDNGGD
ncbi:MAG: PD40 domain-containing protein, partial [Flavobacteriales bacterium]|nr:PD40 domain-containing protein [Flavobacteriales bacterium]